MARLTQRVDEGLVVDGRKLVQKEAGLKPVLKVRTVFQISARQWCSTIVLANAFILNTKVTLQEPLGLVLLR